MGRDVAREADRLGLSLRAKLDLQALLAQTAPRDREENLDLRDTLVLQALRCVQPRARGGGRATASRERGCQCCCPWRVLWGGGPAQSSAVKNSDFIGADVIGADVMVCTLLELMNSMFI